MYDDFPKDSIIVQKYGGTSVGSEERIKKVAARISDQVKAGYQRIAVVVSAMSGETNRLVELVHQINPKASPIQYDMALAAGEQISVALMAAAIEGAGTSARPMLAFQAGIFTDGAHARAKIQSIRTKQILSCWEQKKIPVIAGFQGITEAMELTTLGRGGSDISAVALAVALRAAFCEINTDVDGVFTANPHIVPNAQLIEALDYDSALELAALGSKVLHSRCVELGAKYQMPIVVRNSFLPLTARRTKIMTYGEEQMLESPVVSGITLEEDVAKITLSGLTQDPKVISEIFSLIGEKGINVDIIIHDKRIEKPSARLGFTVNQTDRVRSLEAIQELKAKNGFSELNVASSEDLAKVSVVGLGMRSHSGIASQVFTVLTQSGIDIQMISTSEIKISCVVPQADGKKATQVLHEHFFSKD